MKKRFIEWDLPLADISEAAAKEKSVMHGHPSTLHIWWSRKPLASSRATNFAALIDLPNNLEKRMDLTELIKKITPWEAVKSGNNKHIKIAKQMIKEQWGDNPPVVLDPFSGGGSISLEAIRLGCETFASDYNPVAVLIEKATFEWPQKFGFLISTPEEKPGIDGETKKINLLKHIVKKWGNTISVKAKEEIGQFYPEESDDSIPVGYIWVRTIKCQNPNCGIEIPLTSQFWLANKDKKKVAYKPVVDKSNNRIEFKLLPDATAIQLAEFDPNEGTIRRGNALCPACSQVIEAIRMRQLAQEGKLGQRLVAVVLRHPKKTGKRYRLITPEDEHIFVKAKEYLQVKLANWSYLEKPIPGEELPKNMTGCIAPPNYGMYRFGDLFNDRQKLSMAIFLEKIKEIFEPVQEECNCLVSIVSKNQTLDSINLSKAVLGYLALALDREAENSTTLCRWNPYSEKMQGTFGRQALSMIWNYFETNPFGGSVGDWLSLVDLELNGIQSMPDIDIKAETIQSDATQLTYPENYFDCVITDPPYYNSVPYGDLSDFFYVWLKRSIGDLFPDLFATPLTPKSGELAELAGWDNQRYAHKDKIYFEKNITIAFKEIYRVLKQDGIAVIVYAHRTTEGWETMLNGLVNSGLVVTASWPIHTEMKTRLRAAASATLASSIYMVCRKIKRGKVGFYSEIKPKIKDRIEEKLRQFWNEGIAGGDFFISAIGPGMEIFSRYERVEKLSGKQVTTAELLDYIRSVSTDFIVGKLLKDASSANIDSESEFYLAYRWTYLDNTVEYDDARKLAIASDVNLEELWGPGGFVKKSGSKISIMGPKERGEVDSIRSMVDVMHRCLLLWEKGKKDDLAELLAKTGFADSPAFKQFCQAVAESLLNGNKEKQLLEGFLIGIDNYKRAEVKVSKAQTDLKQYGVR